MCMEAGEEKGGWESGFFFLDSFGYRENGLGHEKKPSNKPARNYPQHDARPIPSLYGWPRATAWMGKGP